MNQAIDGVAAHAVRTQGCDVGRARDMDRFGQMGPDARLCRGHDPFGVDGSPGVNSGYREQANDTQNGCNSHENALRSVPGNGSGSAADSKEGQIARSTPSRRAS